MIFSEVIHQPEESGLFAGSPALLRRHDGVLLATHDLFSSSWRDNLTPRTTRIYASADGGAHWRPLSEVPGAFWSSIFELDDAIYLLGTTCEYGDRIIRRSCDGGVGWSAPAVIQRAGEGRWLPNCHQSANPILIHDGRLFKAVECYDDDRMGGEWRASAFSAQILSARIGDDLLLPESWRFSNALKFDSSWFPGLADAGSGWVEGTLAVAPDGGICSLMRAHLNVSNKAFLLRVSSDGRELKFDPASGLIDLPSGPSKLAIRADESGGGYWALTNPVDDRRFPLARNTLSLSYSDDLVHWRRLTDVLTDDSGLTAEASAALTGFQYPDFLFDGDDLIYLVRMAYRGARNYHDSNRIGFFRLKNFREWIG